MAVDEMYTLGAIVVNHTTTASSVYLNGINQSSVDPGQAEFVIQAAGQPESSYAAIMSVKPVISATVSEISKVLAALGNTGVCWPVASSYQTVDLYFTQMDKCAARKTGSNHIKVTVNDGLMTWGQISASQDAAASITLTIHARYDGTNNPFVYATGQALPTPLPNIAEQFTLGKAMINGTELSGLQSTTVSSGMNVITQSSSGDVYPTFVGIATKTPKIELRTKTISALNTFGLTGTAQGATDSLIYFTKLSENGTRVAAGTAEHVKISVDDGIITTGAAGGSNNESSEVTVMITPTYDGTNAILAITAASAIA